MTMRFVCQLRIPPFFYRLFESGTSSTHHLPHAVGGVWPEVFTNVHGALMAQDAAGQGDWLSCPVSGAWSSSY